MTIDYIKLSQTINSRIFHNLVGSIGAISNFATLANDFDNSMKDNVLALINVSATKLVSQLELYRYAYGHFNDLKKINIIKIEQLISNYLQSEANKVQLEFSCKEITDFDIQIGQMILCIINIICDSMVRGGLIKLNIILDNSHAAIEEINIRAIGKQQKISKEKINILLGRHGNALNLTNCYEYYIRNISKNIGFKILVHQSLNITEYTMQFSK
jgi:hypothetical protein